MVFYLNIYFHSSQVCKLGVSWKACFWVTSSTLNNSGIFRHKISTLKKTVRKKEGRHLEETLNELWQFIYFIKVSMWVFPKIGVRTLPNYQFVHGIFHQINHPFFFPPLFLENTHVEAPTTCDHWVLQTLSRWAFGLSPSGHWGLKPSKCSRFLYTLAIQKSNPSFLEGPIADSYGFFP